MHMIFNDYSQILSRLMFVKSGLTEKCSVLILIIGQNTLSLVFMYVFSAETVTINKKPTTAASM